MKKSYTISEIKELYGFGLDSLRYYEKIGLIHPQRGENGYRLYDLESIYKLNIIKDLRELDFPFKKIKEFLDTRNLKTSKEYLKEEETALKDKISQLQKKQKSLRSKIEYIDRYSNMPGGVINIGLYPQRNCLSLLADIPFGYGLDLLFNKVTKLDDNYLSLIGHDTYGGSLSEDKSIYKKVFLMSQKIKKPNLVLPEGLYSSYIYIGSYTQRGRAIESFYKKTEEIGYKVKGPLLELFHIDDHETSNKDEYVTELTAMVEKIEE